MAYIRPIKNIEWSQMWIGFRGVNMDMRVENGFLRKDYPIFNVGIHEEGIRMFMQAVSVAEQESANYQMMLAGIVNYLLGVIYIYDRNQ